MPQIQPITVVSSPVGANVTVETVFDPLANKDGLTSYSGIVYHYDAATGNVIDEPPTPPVLQETLTLSIARPSKTSRIAKVRIKLVSPVAVLDINGVATNVKSHENSVDMTVLCSEKSTIDERNVLRDKFSKLINSEPFGSVLLDLKSMY